MSLTIVAFKKMIAESIGGYAIEKILDLCSAVTFSKGKTLEEQFVYCIDNSLVQLSRRYGFEYNVSIQRKFFDELINQNNILSEEILTKILRDTVDLEFEDTVIKEWFDLIYVTIVQEKLDILRDYVLITANKSIKTVYPRILTAKPPLPPEEYLNRSEGKIILDMLKKSKKLVLVNGIGGIGKSTVCRHIFHEINDLGNRPLAWVVYNDKNLLDDIKQQLFYPKSGKDWEKRFTKFIEQDIDEEAIIFIDNLNVTEEEETYLEKLSNARCSIVCTSRIEKFSHYKVVPIDYFDEEDCIELFYKYYKLEYNEERIKNIITKAGRHTLVVEILGKIGNAENYSLEELENKLILEGFDLEGIASVEHKEDTLIGHLCRTFNFKKLNAVQRAILYCMAILPVQWIPYDLKKWLKLQNNYNINYLVKYAWFERSESGYYMHPVIKEVVKRGLDAPKDAILQLVIGIGKDISYKENPDFEKSKLLISFIEGILDFIPEEKSNIISQVLYNIAMLYGQFGEYILAEKYVNRCISIEAEQKNSEELLAAAYNHRGYIYYYTFEDSKAERDYLNAYKIRKKLKNKKSIAETTSNIALLYHGMWSTIEDEEKKKKTLYLYKAKKYQKESIRIFEHIFEGTLHTNLASAYNNMAVIYYSLKYYEMAVFYYRKAEQIRLNLCDKISLGDLSVTYKGLCDSYVSMAMTANNRIHKFICYKLALINLNKGIEIRKREIQKGNQKLEITEMLKVQQELENKILMMREILIKL